MNRKILSVIITGVIFFTLSGAQAATTLMQIGRSPFYQPPLTTADSLIAMVQSQRNAVKKGFEKAGRPELFAPFTSQVGSVQIDTVEFQKGDNFEWMFFKKKGKGAVRVAKDVTWGNDKPFTGFQFDIESEGKVYTFVVPLGCGNIAMMGVKEMVAAPPVDAPPVDAPVVVAPNKAPECGMTVVPTEAFCGEMISVDATSSSDPDGEITRMSIAVIDAQGQVVSEKVIEGGGLAGEVAMPCGANTIRTTVTDNDGESATSAACSVNVNGMERIGFLADVGYYNMPDPGNYLFGRVGMEYKFTENWGILGMIGGAPHIGGYDGVSAFLIDLLGEYSFSRYFVNMGVGGWISDGDDDLETEDSQLDFIVGAGARIYGEPEDFNASLFLEVRAAFDEFDDFVDYGRFGFGVRFRF